MSDAAIHIGNIAVSADGAESLGKVLYGRLPPARAELCQSDRHNRLDGGADYFAPQSTPEGWLIRASEGCVDARFRSVF
jgi:hypothetical protein